MRAWTRVAGGRNRGIPYAAWISDALMLPHAVRAQEAKGFGPQCPDRGRHPRRTARHPGRGPGQRRRSKLLFVKRCAMPAPRAIMFCRVLLRRVPGALNSLAKEGISMHYLCTWHDVLAAAKAGKYFTPDAIAGSRSSWPIQWPGPRPTAAKGREQTRTALRVP